MLGSYGPVLCWLPVHWDLAVWVLVRLVVWAKSGRLVLALAAREEQGLQLVAAAFAAALGKPAEQALRVVLAPCWIAAQLFAWSQWEPCPAFLDIGRCACFGDACKSKVELDSFAIQTRFGWPILNGLQCG